MIRFFLIFAFVLGSAQAANATICTIPTTLVNGNIVDAAQLNGNFTSLQSCGNAVDSTNMGSGGIYASQIKPATVGQATFGGAIVYAFPAGLNVNGALLQANAGLTVVGTTNLAATTFSVAPTMSGANITAGTIPNSALVNGGFVDLSATAQTKAGSLAVGGLISTLNGSSTVASGQASFTWNCTNGGGEACIASGGGGSGATASFYRAGAKSALIDGNGAYSNAAGAYVPPMYSQLGGARPGTAHIVQDQATAGATAIGVVFSGAAIFTSALTYTCIVYDTGAGANITSGFSGVSGTGFTFNAVNGRTYTYVCTGF